VNKYLYVAIVSVLAIMPGMTTLLLPAIKRYMGTKDIGLKFGLVLIGEVSAHLVAYHLKMKKAMQIILVFHSS
jgi:hypothetical protein